MTSSIAGGSGQAQKDTRWHAPFFELPFVYRTMDEVHLTKEQQSHWDQLASDEVAPDPLSCGRAWQVTALSHSRRSDEPVIFHQNNEGQVCFSVVKTPFGIRLVPLENQWSFGRPLLGPHAKDLLLSLLGQIKEVVGDRIVQFELPGTFPQDPSLQVLSDHFKPIGHYRQDSHAAASITGDIETWEAQRSPGYRRFLNRVRRSAANEGIRIERLTPCSERETLSSFNRMLAVEKKSWKGLASSGLFDLPSFYYDLLYQYALTGSAMVIFATRDGEDVGFCFGGYIGGIYRGQQTSYAKGVRDLSIGHLMHFETACWLCERNARLHHFGPIQARMDYKRRLCELALESEAWLFSA